MFSSVQSLSRVRLCDMNRNITNCIANSLSITSSQSLPKLMFIESVTQPNHLILCHPFLLLTSIFTNIRVFSNELAVHTSYEVDEPQSIRLK